MVLGTKLLDVDIALMRDEWGSREPTEPAVA
jgi:hypothetical protein